jgi:transposase
MSKQRQLLTDATVIGVDLHSESITACVLTTTAGRFAKPRFFEATTENFMAVFKKHSQPGDTLVIEATTNAFHIAEKLATLDGRKPVVVGSECVADKDRADRVNDRIDAENLANAHISGDTREVWQPSAAHRDMRQLFFARRDAVKNATQAVNRIWALLNARGNKTSRAHIKKAQTPAELLPNLLPGETLHLAHALADHRAALAHRDACDALIAQHAATNGDIQRLLKILGISHLTAFALVAFIEHAKRFENPKKLVRYLGLNPTVHQTGKNKGASHLSHFGRHDLKALLIECAQSAYRHGTLPVHKWARRLVGRRKLYNLGIVALARKLAAYAWHLLMGHCLHDGVEPDAGTLRKFAKLAALVGKPQLKALGYESPGVFVQQMRALHFPCLGKALEKDTPENFIPKCEVPA